MDQQQRCIGSAMITHTFQLRGVRR